MQQLCKFDSIGQLSEQLEEGRADLVRFHQPLQADAAVNPCLGARILNQEVEDLYHVLLLVRREAFESFRFFEYLCGALVLRACALQSGFQLSPCTCPRGVLDERHSDTRFWERPLLCSHRNNTDARAHMTAWCLCQRCSRHKQHANMPRSPAPLEQLQKAACALSEGETRA